jgi:2',3'-cyclic-nucleotide 2'-phosphodiesterase (5'-nucleotidase family)
VRLRCTGAMALTILAASASTGALAAASSLTLFHNNDGESKLLGSTGFGGIDYFIGALNQARSDATLNGRDVLTISSGDNFLAGLPCRRPTGRLDRQLPELLRRGGL